MSRFVKRLFDICINNFLFSGRSVLREIFALVRVFLFKTRFVYSEYYSAHFHSSLFKPSNTRSFLHNYSIFFRVLLDRDLLYDSRENFRLGLYWREYIVHCHLRGSPVSLGSPPRGTTSCPGVLHLVSSRLGRYYILCRYYIQCLYR